MKQFNKNLTFGLDFGTTNSSLSVFDPSIDSGQVAQIDSAAPDPRVVRSMLFFARRQMVIKKNIPKIRLLANVFEVGDILWEGEQRWEIGQKAVEAYLADNRNRSPGVKRTFFTGRKVPARDMDEAKSDLVAEVYEEIDYGTGRLLQAIKSALRTSYQGTTIFGKFYSVEELIGILVGEIKHRAEELVGKEIEVIRVGRPVKFSDDLSIDKKAQDRLEAGLKQAGFKTVEFEFEPVAAAKSYLQSARGPAGSQPHPTSSLRNNSLRALDGAPRSPSPLVSEIVLVFDFGGGTLDTALVKMGQEPEVLAVNGVYIGGDLLNADIVEHKLWKYFGANTTWGDQGLPIPSHLYEALGSWYSIPTLNNPEVMNLLESVKYKNSHPESIARLQYLIKLNLGFELYEAVEQAKKQLSVNSEAVISFKHGPIDIQEELTRQEFEKIIQPRVEEIRRVVLETLKDGKLEAREVTSVVRTGGSSLIPVFEKMLIELFGQDKITLFDTFTSIASGLGL